MAPAKSAESAARSDGGSRWSRRKPEPEPPHRCHCAALRLQHSRPLPPRLLVAVLAVVVLSNVHVRHAHAATHDLYRNARLGTRVVQTRYGRLQGLVLPLDSFKYLRPVEAHLGVPYATPPTLSNRWVFVCAAMRSETRARVCVTRTRGEASACA